MPWVVRARGDEWCVFKEGEEDGRPLGCHASRAQALAQQRALYAQEAQTAAAQRIEFVPSQRIEFVPTTDTVAPLLVAAMESMLERLVATEAVLASVAGALERLDERYKEDRLDLAQALTASAEVKPPVVNVTVPEQKIEVVVPEQPAPVVNVDLPGLRRNVTFERDPVSGEIAKAIIQEE